MTYRKPTQILVDEHEVILLVLEALERVASRDDGEFPKEFYEQAFDFFATFADKCHHAKEEVHLFPMLEQRGIPRVGGPIGCMLHEHEQGRQHVAAVRAALQRTARGDPQARQTASNEALAYAALLRQHIRKENEVLFVLGDQAMSPQDKEQLWQKFQCAEHSTLPPGTHDKCVALAKDLRAKAGL